ncbi:VOC family protein [Phenylobacterium deserti]|uniref:VOC family protein n=1 Tax=Phenylobacterium deserti TaxID=1914756 RepID=A0A328AVV5_9CAUL|nr:VOC family protein [Phenylobacterium deserti]RAK57826.1 VOC family protein [Phenylobacterium deserti]
MTKITPFLWFDTQAEEAAAFYVALFPNSKITSISRYPEGGPGPAGSVMTVSFELDGQSWTALNGGPHFRFNEAVSFVVHCKDQAEVDRYWDGLLAGGGAPSQCGWLKDRFGVSWQVTPEILMRLNSDPNKAKAQAAFGAMMQMVKIDIAALQAAYDAA